jgi:hypothetical protein
VRAQEKRLPRQVGREEGDRGDRAHEGDRGGLAVVSNPDGEGTEGNIDRDDRDPVGADAAAALRIVERAEFVAAGGEVALEIGAEDAMDLVLPVADGVGAELGAGARAGADEIFDIDPAWVGRCDAGIGGRGGRIRRCVGPRRIGTIEFARLEAVVFARGIGFVRHGGAGGGAAQ